MSVSYHGKKSGKPYQTPVSYYRDGDTVYCFTNGSWRANFRKPLAATLRLRGRDYPAIGEIFRGNPDEQIDLMTAYFKAVPQDRKFYGVRCDKNGEPVREHVAQATKVIEILRFTLS